MQENPLNYNEGDPDATIASPRFDAQDAIHAHPVVPLEEVRGRAPFRSRFAPRGRRSWVLTLVVVSLLAVVAVGGIATKVLRRAQSTSPAPATEVPASGEAAAQTASQPARADAQPNSGPAQPEDSTASREEARAHHASRSQGGARDEREGRSEEMTLPPAVARRDDEGADDEGRRGHGKGWEKHRKHEGDDGDDGRRVEGKHGGKKQARLFDVLTGGRP